MVPKVRNDDPVPLTVDLLNPKPTGFNRLLRSAKLQVIAIRGFHFIVLTYTHRDKVMAMSAPPYYVVGVVRG